MISKFRFAALLFFMGCGLFFASSRASAQSTITCSSNDGGRHYCGADVRGGIRLSRQISGSACIQGQTWGYDNNGIWVDRGCRAEFTTGRGGFGGNNGGQALTCSSDDGRRHYCGIDTRGGVRMSRQISGSACIQGQTWGYDNNGVWVDRGCRAEFVSGGNNGRPGNWGNNNRPGNNWNNNNRQTFTCSSDDGRRHYCSIPNGSSYNRVRMSRQISGSACIQGQTWGTDRRGVWVDRGCRAEFQ